MDDETTPGSYPLTAWPIGAIVVRAGVVIEANEPAAALLDPTASAADLVGRPVLDAVVEADRAALADALAEAATRGATGDAVAQVVHGAAGASLELRVRAVSATDALVAVTSHDSERRLEAIIDALADSTLLLDADGLVEWQSRGLARRVPGGGTAGIGINPLERIHPEDLPGVFDTWATAVAHEGMHVRFTGRSRAVEDDDLWQLIEISGSSRLSDPVLHGFVLQVRNLNDGEAVASVAETDGQYLSLADAAPIGIVVTDAYGRTVYRNGAARQLLEQPELRQDTEWREFARGDFQAEVERLLDGATRRGDVGSMTVAFDLPSGISRWLRVHVTPRYAEGRQAIGLITTLEDVTAEVEARAETERLTHMLDATSDYVAIFRPDGEVLYVNESTNGLLQRLVEDGKEGRLRDLIDDEPRRAWIASAMEILEDSDVWQGELELNAGADRKIPVSAMGVISKTADGGLEWIAMHARDVTELKLAEARQREIATHDHLTGLPNRSLFNDRLEKAVARHRRDQRGVAVMFCDLDGFKAVNDEHGHRAGDRVLVAVASRLLSVTRETDTSARVGGDEFVVVCEGIVDFDELATLAERLIEVVVEPIAIDGVTVRVGISVGIGVATSRRSNVDADTLLTLADTAMYRAKARGGNTFRITALEAPDHP